MAYLAGHSNVAFINTPGSTPAPGGSGTPADLSASFDASVGTTAVDGTPIRVVILAFACAAGLVALRASGFRFNVGVSS